MYREMIATRNRIRSINSRIYSPPATNSPGLREKGTDSELSQTSIPNATPALTSGHTTIAALNQRKPASRVRPYFQKSATAIAINTITFE